MVEKIAAMCESVSKNISTHWESITSFEEMISVLQPTRIVDFDAEVHKNILDALGRLDTVPSKSEIKRMVNSGSVYINSKKIGLNELKSDILYSANSHICVTIGKKSPFVIRHASLRIN